MDGESKSSSATIGGEGHQSVGGLLHLTDENFFSTIKSQGLMVTDFWASWCGPCMMMAPVFEEFAKEFEGQIKFAKLNVDENPQTAQQFGIMSIPTFLITDKGKVVDVVIGALPREAFREQIKSYLIKK